MAYLLRVEQEKKLTCRQVQPNAPFVAATAGPSRGDTAPKNDG